MVGRPWHAGARAPSSWLRSGSWPTSVPAGHGLTMTNSSPARRASAKQTEPVLAPADAASRRRPLRATGGGARRRASARQRQRAEDLVYDAWEASGERRAVLAREALALWPDCADAYVLLAQATASNLEQERELLEQGVAAGERALGPGTFADSVGDFWMIFQTRPYMRARAALAATLWRLGRHRRRSTTSASCSRSTRATIRGCASARRTGCFNSAHTTSSTRCSPPTPTRARPRLHLHRGARRVRRSRRHPDRARPAPAGARAQPAHPRLPDRPQDAARAAPRLHRLRRRDRSDRLRCRHPRTLGQRARRAGLA